MLGSVLARWSVAATVAVSLASGGVSPSDPIDFAALERALLSGAAYGAVCIYPGLQLLAARRHRSHSDLDVQLVNTSAWLVTISAAFVLPMRVQP